MQLFQLLLANYHVPHRQFRNHRPSAFLYKAKSLSLRIGFLCYFTVCVRKRLSHGIRLLTRFIRIKRERLEHFLRFCEYIKAGSLRKANIDKRSFLKNVLFILSDISTNSLAW
ncbi:hypothetical protein [Paenibacillus tyrfis]|uniref:hypothetical protein n=1 Tax=Paenibacillus tyrfis TaxID=1501230 RepID=UPI0020A08AC1|nr:hypothetical protein [Paenibacillus tyrfis]MCP1306706.1 hypothetical protein [Paenibacillus tyrfis]